MILRRDETIEDHSLETDRRPLLRAHAKRRIRELLRPAPSAPHQAVGPLASHGLPARNGSHPNQFLGLLVDRVQRPSLVVVGPLLTICAMSLIGRVGTFEQLVLLMLVSGLGTALFHPAAAALVATGSVNNRGLVMAFFSAGGTLGGALAPLLIVTAVGVF